MCMVSLPTADSLQTHWESQHSPPEEETGRPEVWSSGACRGEERGEDVE